MDVALTNAIIHTATALEQSKTAEAVQMNVLKKSMDIQANAAATLLESVVPVQPTLATEGALGTQFNAYA